MKRPVLISVGNYVMVDASLLFGLATGSGSEKLKTEPSFSLLSTPMVPPIISTSFLADRKPQTGAAIFA